MAATEPITGETTLRNIRSRKELLPAERLIFNAKQPLKAFTGNLKLKHYLKLCPDWNITELADGLNYLSLLGRKKRCAHHIYGEEERKRDKSLRDTGILHFPAERKGPFALICPGGGYGMVAAIGEGLPVAKRLNELGISAFVLKYRTGKAAMHPNPLNDLAGALRMILDRAEEFNIDEENYALAGFSAGGHLVSCFGTASLGYSLYGLPRPGALFLGYPVINFVDYPHLGSRKRLLGGEAEDPWTQKRFSTDLNITPDYPAAYVWHCTEDKAVHPANSIGISRELKRKGVPLCYRAFSGTAHGWGLGTGTPAEGWLDEAVEFWLGISGG